MKKSEFLKLHMDLSIKVEKTREVNPEPSATDPTQDIPVRMIEVTAMGVPTNVKQFKEVFSNVKAENFTTIEKRFNDVFDQLGELQSAVGKFRKKDITTNFVQPKKQQKKHEI